MTILSVSEINDLLPKLNGWELDGGAIRRTITLPDFPAAIKLVNDIASAAEEMNHHPDIAIQYNKVTFTISTHSEGGLTKNDFELAGKIDNLAK